MNPRYVAYAKAHDKTPGEMMLYDNKRWPGGRMIGFMLWIQEQKRAFRDAHPEAFYLNADRRRTMNIIDFEAWDRFLGVESN